MMKKIRCIAIDDEPLALLVIERFCERKGGMELTTFCEPRTGWAEIACRKPDLVFLDIEMNSLNGIEIANLLPNDVCFIFTTAHARYALEGFDLDAVDFLHKPFAYERFEKAVDKAIRRIEAQKEAPAATITLKQEYNNVTIPVNDILYIEAMENYIKIHRLKEKSVLSRTSLKSIQDRLPKDCFIRIHKSYIIPLAKIERYTQKQLWLRNLSTPLPIGRTYMTELLKQIQKGDESV